MDWELYEKNKKNENDKEMYKTMCKVLAVIIVIICFLWYRSDNGRTKWIEELKDEIEAKQEKIEELENHIEYLEEEYL